MKVSGWLKYFIRLTRQLFNDAPTKIDVSSTKIIFHRSSRGGVHIFLFDIHHHQTWSFVHVLTTTTTSSSRIITIWTRSLPPPVSAWDKGTQQSTRVILPACLIDVIEEEDFLNTMYCLLCFYAIYILWLNKAVFVPAIWYSRLFEKAFREGFTISFITRWMNHQEKSFKSYSSSIFSPAWID